MLPAPFSVGSGQSATDPGTQNPADTNPADEGATRTLRAHDATGWQVPSTGPAARHHVCRPPPSRPKSYACHRPSGAVLYALGRPARKTRTRGGEERSKRKRGSFLPASPATSAAHAMPRASSERRMKAMARSHRRDGTGTGAQRVQRHSHRSAPGSAPASTNVPLTHRCAPCSAARSLHSGMDFPHRSRHPPHDDDEAVAPHTARPEAASAPPPDQQFLAYSRHPPSPLSRRAANARGHPCSPAGRPMRLVPGPPTHLCACGGARRSGIKVTLRDHYQDSVLSLSGR